MVVDQFGRTLQKHDRVAFCTIICKKIVWKRATIVDIHKGSVTLISDDCSRKAVTENTHNMILLDRTLDKPV